MPRSKYKQQPKSFSVNDKPKIKKQLTQKQITFRFNRKKNTDINAMKVQEVNIKQKLTNRKYLAENMI